MIWEQIRANRVRSVFLTLGMGLLLLLLGYGIGLYFFDNGIAGLIIAFIVWGILTLVAYYQGDSILLGASHARKIGPDDHPRLYNVVEEMKIASGLEKMPDVYIVDDPALNAFATGRDPNKASIAVTSGLLQKMNRDQLQGVVGHEVSHIKNRDVLLMAMAGVLLGAIVVIAWYASRYLIFGGMGRSRRSSSGGGGAAIIIVMVVAIVLMILAPIFAQLIYYALSRRREYLADASSALYTRYPEGLASALEKIAGSTDEVKAANKATAPMYIANPFRKKGRAAADLTSTHPPTSERIRILRAMAGGSFKDYDAAYREVKQSRGGIVPASGLALASEPVPLKGPSATAEEDPKEELDRARETSNTLWQMNKYKTVDCQCGTRFRIPPGYTNRQFQCPHCGRINQV